MPEPCISVAATYAFQYGTEPKPVHVCRFTPASPNAGGISVPACLPSGRNALPSLSSSASKRPGPQLVSTFFTVATSVCSRSAIGCRFGASDRMRPMFRSRLAQASRRLPIPGAKELSTCEWHSAHCAPSETILPESSNFPVRPTTALSLSSASVVAGSSRFTLPAAICCLSAAGSASESTLRPTASAVLGLTPGPTPPFAAPAIALCSCSVSPKKASDPNVSKRKI